MNSTKLRAATARVAAVAAIGLALGVGACATNYDQQFAEINGRLDTVNVRLDSLDARVNDAVARADAAGQAANAASAEARAASQMGASGAAMAPRSPRG